MRFSVYDYTRRVYDYYEAPGPGGTHAGSPQNVQPERKIGASPGRASWRLPIGARKVGTGEMPQGRIASLDGADLFSSPNRLIMYAALGYVTWRILR